MRRSVLARQPCDRVPPDAGGRPVVLRPTLSSGLPFSGSYSFLYLRMGGHLSCPSQAGRGFSSPLNLLSSLVIIPPADILAAPRKELKLHVFNMGTREVPAQLAYYGGGLPAPYRLDSLLWLMCI